MSLEPLPQDVLHNYTTIVVPLTPSSWLRANHLITFGVERCSDLSHLEAVGRRFAAAAVFHIGAIVASFTVIVIVQ